MTTKIESDEAIEQVHSRVYFMELNAREYIGNTGFQIGNVLWKTILGPAALWNAFLPSEMVRSIVSTENPDFWRFIILFGVGAASVASGMSDIFTVRHRLSTYGEMKEEITTLRSALGRKYHEILRGHS